MDVEDFPDSEVAWEAEDVAGVEEVAVAEDAAEDCALPSVMNS